MLTQTSQLFKSLPAMPVVEEDNMSGISHLIAAAVVDSSFRKLLLTNPAHALEKGYRGQFFRLSNEERHHILSIRASSLPEFATQLLGC